MPSWDAVGLQAPSHLAALAVACGVVVALIFRVRLAAALSNVRKMYCDAGWEAYVDDEGRTYYYNELSGVTTWERPGCVPVACRQLAMVVAWVARLAMAAVAWAVELFKRCAGAPLRKAWDATYAHRFEKLHEESDAEVAADATTDAADIEANAVNNGDQGDDPDAAPGAPEEQEEADEAPAEPVKKPKYEKPSGPPKQTKRGSVLSLGVGQRSKVRGAASMFESGAIAERQEKEREEREKETRRASLRSTSAATAEAPAGAPAASEDGAAKEKEEEKTETKESAEDAGDVKEGADANAEGAPASEAVADGPAAAPAASDE